MENEIKNIIDEYIEKINRIYSTREATEHSYRAEFKQLCEGILNGSSGYLLESQGCCPAFQLINEPKRKKYGAPDYELLKGDTAIAFIEAKNIGDSDLKGIKAKKNKTQFDRYKSAVSHIAFTDYLNIVLFENGEESLSASIGRVVEGNIVFNDDPLQLSNFTEIMNRL